MYYNLITVQHSAVRASSTKIKHTTLTDSHSSFCVKTLIICADPNEWILVTLVSHSEHWPSCSPQVKFTCSHVQQFYIKSFFSTSNLASYIPSGTRTKFHSVMRLSNRIPTHLHILHISSSLQTWRVLTNRKRVLENRQIKVNTKTRQIRVRNTR